MFYCDKCAEKNGYPETASKSRGACEVCGEQSICNDMKDDLTRFYMCNRCKERLEIKRPMAEIQDILITFLHENKDAIEALRGGDKIPSKMNLSKPINEIIELFYIEYVATENIG